MNDQFKDVILDSPFEEDIQSVQIEKKEPKSILAEGETVIWEDSPNHSYSIFDKNYTPLFFMKRIFKYVDLFGFAIAVSLATLIAGEDFIPVLIMAALVFPFLLLYHYLIYKRRKGTKYILTSKKLVFVNWIFGFKRTYFIPLSNMRELSFKKNKNYGVVGDIHFVFQNETILPSRTRNFIKNLTWSSPIFKNIKNVKQVYHSIKRIKAKNKKYEKHNSRRTS